MQSINDKYINIQGWMVNELKLKGNDLLVYAIIYGFSQDEESEFTGSLSYLATWCNCTKNGVQKNLKNLTDLGYITKKTTIKNGVKYCAYSCIPYNIVVQGIQQSCTGHTTELYGGIQQSCTNNININNKDKIEDKQVKKNSKKDFSKLVIDTCLKNDIEDDKSIELIESFLEDMKIKTPRAVEANIAKLAGKPYSIISRCINTSFSRNYRYITPPEWLTTNNTYGKRLQENINSITADEHKANLEQYRNNPDTFKF